MSVFLKPRGCTDLIAVVSELELRWIFECNAVWVQKASKPWHKTRPNVNWLKWCYAATEQTAVIAVARGSK